MADKAKYPVVKFNTPAVVSIYPRLNEPDTKYKPEGEYSVKLAFGAGEFPADLIEKLEALRDEKAQSTKVALTAEKKGAKAKSLTVRDILTAETDKETGEETGRFLINAKMKASGVTKAGKAWTRSPDIFDAKGTKLTGKAIPSIWGGSVLKVAIEAAPYYTPKDNEVGVSFRLQAVQIIKLVSGGNRDAGSYGFGEEQDGYAAGPTVDDSEAGADDDAPLSGDNDDDF